MNFNVTLIDPVTYKFAYFLTDTCRTIAAGLRALGHQCNLSVNNVDESAMNVIVGTHLLSGEDATSIARAGVKYIAFQSEWLHRKAGAAGVQSSFTGNQLERHTGELFQRADSVWDCLDSNLPMLRRMGIARRRTRLYSPGFHEDLVDVRHRPFPDKDIDIFFFGSITPHRAVVLNELSQHFRVLSAFDAPSAFRNDMIARTRINIVLQSAEELSYLPPQRVGYLLNNRCFVLADTASEGGPLDDLVYQVDRASLLERCRELLAGSDLARLSEESFERYRQRPITQILEALLDQRRVM